MRTSILFTSNLGPLMKEFVKEKRSMGFSYDTEERLLGQFDRFIVANGFDDGTFERPLISGFSRQLPSEGKNYRNKRMVVIRQFAYYLLSMGMTACVPESGGPSEKPMPYLMDNQELSEFFSCVDRYSPHRKQDQMFAIEYSCLFRVIYCCGLRISEACNLRCDDVDLSKGILRILHSKGDKDRMVYLSEDCCQLCRSYDVAMINYLPSRLWFFPGKKHKSLPITSADAKFKYFWNMRCDAKTDCKSPTVHTLRHLFVVNTINKWIKDGIDVDAKLMYLAKYLGHASAPESLYYYHQVVFSGSLVGRNDSIRTRVIPEVQHHEES
jgi:integrase/recombinase XerD